MDWSFLYAGGAPLAVVMLSAPLAYAGVVVILRIGGKRTLADFNAFDFVVSVALGSLLAATVVNPSVAVAEGLAAIALLVALQAGIARLTTRSRRARAIVQSRPRLVAHRGQVIEAALRATRLSEDDLNTAARQAGFAAVGETGAIIIESNGKISVLG
ncbi:MAG: DUF421 domain-containing protein, partial [Shimia sp.]